MSVTVSVHGVIVVVLWTVGAVLAVLDALSPHSFGALAHLFVAGGATLYLAGRLERVANGWLMAYRAGREVTRLRPPRSN